MASAFDETGQEADEAAAAMEGDEEAGMREVAEPTASRGGGGGSHDAAPPDAATEASRA